MRRQRIVQGDREYRPYEFTYQLPGDLQELTVSAKGFDIPSALERVREWLATKYPAIRAKDILIKSVKF